MRAVKIQIEFRNQWAIWAVKIRNWFQIVNQQLRVWASQRISRFTFESCHTCGRIIWLISEFFLPTGHLTESSLSCFNELWDLSQSTFILKSVVKWEKSHVTHVTESSDCHDQRDFRLTGRVTEISSSCFLWKEQTLLSKTIIYISAITASFEDKG